MSSSVVEEIALYQERLDRYAKLLIGSMSGSLSQRKRQQLHTELYRDFESLILFCLKNLNDSVKPENSNNKLVESAQCMSDTENIQLKHMNHSLFEQLLSVQECCEEQKINSNSLKDENNLLNIGNKKVFENLLELQCLFEVSNEEHSSKEKRACESKSNEVRNSEQTKDSSILFKEFLVLQEKYSDREKENTILEKKLQHLELEEKTLFNQLILLQNRFGQENIISDSSVKENKIVQYQNDSKSGASTLVKNSISYQLGNQIIQGLKTKKISNTVKNILATSLEHHYDTIVKELESLENLDNYIDKQDAEKAKKHLSFLIGKTILSNISSKSKLKKIPQELLEEFILFRRAQKVD